VVVKTVERNAANLFEARKCLTQRSDSEQPGGPVRVENGPVTPSRSADSNDVVASGT